MTILSLDIHIPLDVELTPESKYINLGDWITNFTYAEFNGKNLSLKRFDYKLVDKLNK